MGKKKISEYGAPIEVLGDELIPIVQSGVNKNTSPNLLLSLLGSRVEVISFTSVDSVKVITWDNARKSLFGVFPQIQVWAVSSGGLLEIITVPISTDAPPPSQTTINIYTPQVDGFIILK